MRLIELNKITKIYGKGEAQTIALDNIDLIINYSEMIGIMGPSGCGKSTLLNIIGCIDIPTKGKYTLENNEISKLNFNSLSKIRNQEISFIFQNFALLKEFSVIENVMLPLNFRRLTYREKKDKSLSYLKKLGIEQLCNKKIKYLSGGQQQRVAIARTLVQESKIILADEPTGALDQKNSKIIMDILKDLNKSENKTILIVTHDINVAKYCNKILNMRDGKLL
ncbi:ABC transporter ATP-binding protein [Clostridium tetani]|uniref:ABC transporter ATP-binding protein n=1 Tax=Clostridium tetani TaxID=1513 RepID=UPI0038B38D2F